MPGQELALTIDPDQALRLLLIITAVLVLLSLAGQGMIYYLPDFPLRDGFANTFDANNELSVPTLYSSVMLLIGAVLAGMIAHAEARGRRGHARSWTVLTLILALMAVDESVALHEQASEPIRELLSIERGLLLNAWVIPGAILVALVAALLAWFMRHLPRATRLRICAAGGLYVGGAIGIELIGASYASDHGTMAMTYELIVTVEETLEMLGIALLLWALLAHISVAFPETRWQVGIEARAAPGE